MPSGKKSKQQRRQAVPAPPVRSGAGGARQASPRTLAIAGGVLALVILAVVLGIVLSQGSGSGGGTTTGDGNGDGPTIILAKDTPETGSSAKASVLYATDVANLLKGIPQHGLVLGDPNAPVTLVEWIDLQCPVCQIFETTEFPNLVTKFVRTGKLKVELKPWNIIDGNFPGSDDSLRGQKATIAASKQNTAFTFAELLYYNQPPNSEGQGWMKDGVISNIAASVDGMNTSTFVSDANAPATQQAIKAFDNFGNNQLSQQVFAAGQTPGTPTLLLAKGNGKPVFYGTGWGSPPMDPTDLEAAITRLAKQK
jgi:hypothetical protein